MTAAVHDRDDVLEDVELHADEQDRARIDQAIADAIAAGDAFSANDLRAQLEGVRAALIGARFMAAVRRGRIERVDWVRSTDRGTHAKVIGLYRPAVRA